MNPPAAPPYGTATLGELVPSVLSALGVAGLPNPLRIEPAERACVLLVDGLGLELLAANADRAPEMARMLAASGELSSGFPSSTAVSLGSFGTGGTPAEHGVVGVTLDLPGHERPMNVLRWSLHGVGEHVDLAGEIPPERFQPLPTLFERAATAGIATWSVGAIQFAHSGLTRAMLRGGTYVPAFSLGDLAAETVATIGRGPRSLVYSYHHELDLTGHIRGAGSEAWRSHLAHIEQLVVRIAERLPSGCLLIVTGDHGMVDIEESGRVDVEDDPALMHGVRMLAGEPRARHVHARPGAVAEVLAAWRERVGHGMWVLEREDAIARGWFGPHVSDPVRSRVGDVVAASFAPMGVTNRALHPIEARMVGHHGSLTAAETRVPFLQLRG